MRYQQTTQVANELFDTQLKELSHSQLKILLHIIRKTYGWTLKNGKRKTRDRISHSQFIQSTGISRRSLPITIQSLILKQLVKVTDYSGQLLHTPESRKGKLGIFYAPLFKSYANESNKVGKKKQLPVQNGLYNKTKRTKLKRQKSFERQSDWERMQELLILKR
ncbi:replication protein [Maribacter sp.]|nr:replication protein [Maribacter sp.]